MPKGKTPRSIFTTETVLSEQGTTSSGSDDTYEFFRKDVFSNPKPVKLIMFLLGFSLGEDDIVLDFFSGSGTTAEAVYRMNCKGYESRFILVQLKENIDKMLASSSANAKRVAENAISVLDEVNKPHYITELAEERILRAGRNMMEKYGKKTDFGYRVYTIDDSNMEDVFYEPSKVQQTTLDMSVNNIKPDRTSLDLLVQVMLDLGVSLSSAIQDIEVAGKKVYKVDEKFLVACFDNDITDDVVEKIAKMKPVYAVLRDSGMMDDSVATNFDQIFETYSPNTERRVL